MEIEVHAANADLEEPSLPLDGPKIKAAYRLLALEDSEINGSRDIANII